MAKNKCVVYLGYEDEYITEKNKLHLDYTTNKIGGKADWPYSDIFLIPNCPCCGLTRILIAQIYAPIENSQFHRTLYIFSCISPVCSNQSQSWLCVRSQLLEKVNEKETLKSVSNTNIKWCNDLNDWDEPETIVSIADTENCNEENGNVIKTDNNRVSDEDEETNSMESDPIPAFDNLQVDDKNANCGAQGGAVGRILSPNASAEIEEEESEIITIETPIKPQRDFLKLLKQTPEIPTDLINSTLKSFFIAVDEEKSHISVNDHVNLQHARELMQEYQTKDEGIRVSPDQASGGASDNNSEQEHYEKDTPAHGDVMFHNFLLKISENPGQILRYSRQSFPLLINPLKESIQKCGNCGSDVICEVQLLPTLIPKLKLENGDPAPIEFGNVLVFTCNNNCWDTPDKMRIENVIVQQEMEGIIF